METKQKLIAASLLGLGIILVATMIVTAMLRQKTNGGVPTAYDAEGFPAEQPKAPQGVPESVKFTPIDATDWTLRILGTVQEIHPTSLVIEVQSGEKEPKQFTMPIAPTTSVEKTYVLSRFAPKSDVYSELRVSEAKNIRLGTEKVLLAEVQAGDSIDAQIVVRSGGTWEAARVVVTPAKLSL